MDSDKSNISTAITGRMIAGFAAGSFATVLTHPMDVIRANITITQANSTSMYIIYMCVCCSIDSSNIGRGIINTGSVLWKSDGIRGLYRGLIPTIVAIAPFIAIQQSSYDSIKHLFTTQGMKPSTELYLLCGSVAGMTAQTVRNSNKQ